MRLLVVVAILNIHNLAQAQSPESLWMARGIDAAKKIKAATVDTCAKRLEVAYALHFVSDKPPVVVEKDGSTAYHLILGDEGADVAFFYMGPDTVLRVDHLPPHWQIMVAASTMPSGQLVLAGPDCLYMLNARSPLSGTAHPRPGK